MSGRGGWKLGEEGQSEEGGLEGDWQALLLVRVQEGGEMRK